MAASRRAASPAAPSPPSARYAAEQRSIPRRPWPRPVELQHRQLHRRRVPASHQSSGRSHDAHGRVVSSCSTGSSIAVARSPRSRAAVDSTTPMAASRRAASPAAPSPPPARLAAERRSILDAHGRDVSGCITGSSIAPPARLAVERRSIPRRPRPRRVELHHRQLHRRRLLASQQAAVDPTTPMAASRRAASTAAPSLPPPARLAAEQRSIPQRPRPCRVELHHRQLHHRRLLASQQSSGRSRDAPWPPRVELHHRQLHRRRLLAAQQSSGRPHDAPGRVASSCTTCSSIAVACSPRSRAAVDPATLAAMQFAKTWGWSPSSTELSVVSEAPPPIGSSPPFSCAVVPRHCCPAVLPQSTPFCGIGVLLFCPIAVLLLHTAAHFELAVPRCRTTRGAGPASTCK